MRRDPRLVRARAIALRQRLKALLAWQPLGPAALLAEYERSWPDLYETTVDNLLSDFRRGRLSDCGLTEGLVAAKTWAQRQAELDAPFAGLPRWSMLRCLIYLRDRGMCWLCGQRLKRPDFDLGHLVDRACGGLDTPDNLAVMCPACNRIHKPLHHSQAEALAWRDAVRQEYYFRCV